MQEMQSLKVAVLEGGVSAEREVSLRSGEKIAASLRSAGCSVVEYDTKELSFIEKLLDNRPDVVYIALHGRHGEDGTVQGLCELLDIPYVGSGVLASSLAIDKVMSKRFYEQAGIPTPRYLVAENTNTFDIDAFVARTAVELGEKTVVKPANEGSSIGMSIVHALDELPHALEYAFEYDSTVLVEQFIEGVEVTVGVLGNECPRALPTIEVVAQNEFYDYAAKYEAGMSKHIIPARVGTEANKLCSDLAEQTHAVLGCRSISRSDFIVDADGGAWLLETNTLPGMTDVSLVPDAAKHAGIDFSELCVMLVSLALEK